MQADVKEVHLDQIEDEVGEKITGSIVIGLQSVVNLKDPDLRSWLGARLVHAS